MIPAVTSLSVFFFLLRGILHILSKEERERDERLNQRRENLRIRRHQQGKQNQSVIIHGLPFSFKSCLLLLLLTLLLLSLTYYTAYIRIRVSIACTYNHSIINAQKLRNVCVLLYFFHLW